MSSPFTTALRFLLLVLALGRSSVLAQPPLLSFPTLHADALGRTLQSAVIWTQPVTNPPGVAIAFRKTVVLTAPPAHAELHLFADARYVLWVNGTYVDRGPARFQPNGPEYDTLDLTAHLSPGTNVLALLVVGNLSGGKVMRHVPGLTAVLTAHGRELCRTDASWKWSNQTRFRKITASWADLRDAEIDARVEAGDWTQVNYPDATWAAAGTLPGDAWGPLTARRIPLLRETPVPFTLGNGATLPVTLAAGQKLTFDTARLVQAYPVITLDATAGTELDFAPFGVKYTARAGRQTHFTIDTSGFTHGEIIVKSGTATLTSLQLIERLYPFDIAGRFTCNDDELNRLWALCARSGQVLSEDSYVDCADRERVEWMDDDPPGYDISRTLMSSPGASGPVYADPRLLAEVVRRTALTLQPNGWVKAHTCSDRYDIHAKMEDRACDWVAGIRRYYEATGDKTLIREIWPAVVAQMNYFLDRRTSRGLVLAREWVIWGNPLGYETEEGAGINAFVYRALADAALLGRHIGQRTTAARFQQAADDLAAAFNRVLWDAADGTYYSGYDTEPAQVPPGVVKGRGADLNGWHLKPQPPTLANHLIAPTVFPAHFALDQGIVPPDRRAQVTHYLLTQPDPNARIMYYYYLWKQLYAADQPALDQQVLDTMRQKWHAMADWSWQTSWEEFNGGSKAHIYGMYPGYFLSAYVLGVRRAAPVAEHQLRIEPHLGDLTNATGVIITEFGPVPVAWQHPGGSWQFTLTAPAHVKTVLALPYTDRRTTLTLDGQTVTGKVAGTRLELTLRPGRHQGMY